MSEKAKGFECTACGKWHDFHVYVFAHWSDVLTHSCDCGAKHELLRGTAKPMKNKRAKNAGRHSDDD